MAPEALFETPEDPTINNDLQFGCREPKIILIWAQGTVHQDIKKQNNKKNFFAYYTFFLRTPYFSPRLDVLIFSAISASNVLIDVLKYLTIKIRYLYSTIVYLLLNTIVFSLNYKMK